jgi:hypothetical protein
MRTTLEKLYIGMYIQEALGILPRRYEKTIKTLYSGSLEIYKWNTRKCKVTLNVVDGKVRGILKGQIC